MPGGEAEGEVDGDTGLDELPGGEVAGRGERNFDDEAFGADGEVALAIRDSAGDVVAEVGVEFDADVGVEPVDEAEGVVGVEDEGDFEDDGLRVEPAEDAGGFGHELVVDAFLDFFVEEGVIGRQRVEGGVPEFAGFVEVAGIEPEAGAGGLEFGPFGIRLGRDGGLAEGVLEVAADEFVDGLFEGRHGRSLGMSRGIVNMVACVLWAGVALAAELPFKELPLEKLSSSAVSDWGKMALAIQPGKWKHGETEHFIIHFTRNGDKVARRSEEYYTEIKEFFGNRPDLMKWQKSQVFAFHDVDDWRKFAVEIGQSWAAGITRGDEFFYAAANEDGRFDSKGKVQAHEMTHLVFNRFFHGHLPLWLNEGIAEYFGQRKTATLTEFRRQMGATEKFPLASLFEAQTYPNGAEQMQAFYAEAAIVVDFLTKSADRRALLPKFVDAMIAGQSLGEALKVYGYASEADFAKEYQRYRKHF